ncbi:MAG: hypothetical protein Q7U57_07655 [Methylovulum sp.]|nr:hypothetical protein [Methylovulum sp.]
MSNLTNKEIEHTRAAYIAGRDAIIKQLGKDAPMEDIADVVLLMAHSVLTGYEQLDARSALHNADTFHKRLRLVIEDSQKNVTNNSYAGRLM